MRFPIEKVKRRNSHVEADLQTICVRWFRIRYPSKWIFAIPNGGKRSMFEAARLKREGVTAGVWDLFVPEPMGGYPGLWVEMKAGKNKLTDSQEIFGADMQKRGYKTMICWNFEEFQIGIDCYFK